MYAYMALAGLQLVGGFQQADIIRKNGDLQSSIADMNAKYADLDAHNALAAGYSNAAKYQNTVDEAQGATKAAYASEGVDVKYGTASDVQTDNKTAGLINTLEIQRQAQNAAVGYETQGINLRLGGQMTKLQSNLSASAAEAQGITGAISTGVAGYAYSQSTGKGTTSRTGTDAKPGMNRSGPAMINLTSSGDGVQAPRNFFAGGAMDESGGSSFTDEVA